ncbi:tol-pal system protein YbgF [Algihabitans albus]|uniref:tol-pal system protein YbgF n=1 Tax=Algihabitans albus TaxID=2164067 RepID=UPI000E5DA01F|nr:tol-pal system protein YbgF [Algihabitans albus]
MSFLRFVPIRRSCLVVAALLISGPALASELTDEFTDEFALARAEVSGLNAAVAEVVSERRLLATQLAQATGLNAAQAAQFERRLSGLEAELRRITGRLEDANFGVRQLQQRMERFESETKARLLRLEQGQPSAPPQTPSATYTPPDGSGTTVLGSAGATAPDTAAVSTPAGGVAGGQAGDQTGRGQPGPLQPRTLGTISDQDLAAARQGAATQQGAASGGVGTQQALAPTPALPSDDPQAAYNSAFELLRRMDYPAAESAFGQYLTLYPESNLAGNAKYWLGETHYVRGDYETAAVVFAEGYQSYPDSGKAPDNLLKLGMSLSNLGATEDACATFSELQSRYPNAAPTVLQRALRESQRLGCN